MNTAPTELISVRIKEACRITGIGRSKLYELIAAGEIRTVKVGSMTLVPVSGLRALIEGGTPSSPQHGLPSATGEPRN